MSGNNVVLGRGSGSRVGAGGTPLAQKRLNTSKNVLLKVVILGNGGVGKSCLMNRFVSNHFDQHSFHTIGVEFLNKDLEINGETYTLQIWDTAGQERFKSLRTPFYRGSDVCLITYAVNDQKSFKDVSMWCKEFLTYADVKEGSTFPFILVGNKADVSEEGRQVTQEEARTWCKENGNPPFIETSAKDAINVELAFQMAVDRWIKFEEKMDRHYESEVVDLRSVKPPQRASCCMNGQSSRTEE
ncbi:Ras-related protein Rab-9A [Frankliniella fusca]|uniref:small monomeric GTPase n=1 Tax=Frankliniella fusca TaxID=407009 RepID=A0AAE1LB91_9NEOP|nr:Ras-related protein Rab-9A [Frankliniella fusca]